MKSQQYTKDYSMFDDCIYCAFDLPMQTTEEKDIK
jgi:hypothetical protein